MHFYMPKSPGMDAGAGGRSEGDMLSHMGRGLLNYLIEPRLTTVEIRPLLWLRFVLHLFSPTSSDFTCRHT